MTPFFVLGTPRSRTAWLASFLSYQGRECVHEPCRFWCGIDSLRAACADDRFAASDSLLTLRWREIVQMRPDAVIVVVRRGVCDVADSLMAASGQNLFLEVAKLDRCIEDMQTAGIGHHFDFEDLSEELVCGHIFRLCHGVPMPRAHWKIWREWNIQADPFQRLAEASMNPRLFDLFPEMRGKVWGAPWCLL
jgi:hypothetical protein